MKIFYHHIYEYKKGLRDLVLHTTRSDFRPLIEKHLEKEQIAYIIHPIGDAKINVFFGNNRCVEVIAKINKSLLSHYTPEEDFILGALLGYSKIQQCERYLERVKRYQEQKIKEVS